MSKQFVETKLSDDSVSVPLAVLPLQPGALKKGGGTPPFSEDDRGGGPGVVGPRGCGTAPR